MTGIDVTIIDFMVSYEKQFQTETIILHWRSFMTLNKLALATFIAFALSGCGGGGGGDNGSTSNSGNTGNSGNTTPTPTPVVKANQTINGLPVNIQSVGTSVALPQNTTSNLVVQYQATTPAVCSITNNYTLNFTSLGQCVVTYSQAGDANTNALNGSLSVTVSPSATTPTTTASYYDLQSDVKGCKSGVINDFTRNQVLSAVNDVRKLHGLEPVSYNKDFEPMVAEAALAMAAQGTTSHTIDSTWLCYSDLAQKGAKLSSLHVGISTKPLANLTPADTIVAFMRENMSNSLGHRRWLLSPFLKETSFGLADGATNTRLGYAFSGALYMYNPDTHFSQTTTSPLGIYPYPVGNYPKKYYNKGDRLSVFVLNNQTAFTNYIDNNASVDYSKATITVTDSEGKAHEATDVKYDNLGQGVKNNLSFLLPDFDYGVKYTVKIDNVVVAGVSQNYQYDFKVE